MLRRSEWRNTAQCTKLAVMKKHLTLLQGVTQCHFHAVPSELSMITVTPERAAISEHLARIKYDEFPEFVRDILKSQGHTDVRITDGVARS